MCSALATTRRARLQLPSSRRSDSELGEHPRRLARLRSHCCVRLLHLRPDDRPQPLIARQARTRNPRRCPRTSSSARSRQKPESPRRMICTSGHAARICATIRCDLLPGCRPRRRCWLAAAARTAGDRRRRCTAAGSSSCRSSRGRSGPPAGRAAARRWHPDPGRSAPALRRATSRNTFTSSSSIAVCPVT